MTAKEMQQRKRELGLTYQEIADRCGLSVPTVQRIITGDEYRSRDYSREMIENVLEAEPVLKEGEAAYKYEYQKKKQGEYTAEDYFQLPEDERCELIDGVIYDLTSPIIDHQDIAGEVYYQLRNFLDQKKGKCKVFISPLDVKLDDKTIVQPDVMIICDRSKGSTGRIVGAPDFVMEVVSPSTKSRDYVLKLNKYLQRGVREYWIVDQKDSMISVYLLGEEWGDEGGIAIKSYSFDDKVPVSVWGGECLIDFSVLEDSLWNPEE